MKPLVVALAAVLLSSCGRSKAPALAQAGSTRFAPAPVELAALTEGAVLPDPAPADVEVPSAPSTPSAEELAAFHAPVPK